MDLRRDLTAPEALDALALAVRDEAARPEAVRVAVCPYLSLRAFQEEHAAFFFGREAFADRLRDAVLGRNLVAVVGPSGSGKSSVVQAGLLPLLRRQRPPARTWDAASFTPGKQPFHRLAAALIPLLEPGLGETDRLTEAQKLGDRLECGEVYVEATIERLVIKSEGTDRLLVVAEQFEELFTQMPEAARRPFVEAVLGALDRAPLTLMLTLRADFYGHVIALSRELSDRVEQTVVNLGPMRREELERAIVEPARRVGLAFDPGLADRLLDDVGEEPGHLPLLEFALTELWTQRQVGILTQAAYRSIGGVAGAIAQRAEAEFATFTPERQAIARRVFTRLVRVARPEEGAEDTRQRATLAELSPHPQLDDAAEVGAIVQALTGWESRLLVTGLDQATGEETVEVAHEALIQHWKRLRDWLDEDREFLLWRQRLRGAVAEWEHAEHDAGGLLRGAPLAEAERWMGERPNDLTLAERRLIQESVALREREQGVRDRLRRQFIWAIAGVLVVVLLFAFLDWQQRNTAIDQAKRAMAAQKLAEVHQDKAEQQTALALSRGLAAEARNYLNKRLDLALLLSVEAHRRAETPEARQALYTVLDAARSSLFLHGHQGDVWRLLFSPDGKTLASGGMVGTLLLWDLRVTPPRAIFLPGHQGNVWSLTFSPDGQTLASGDEKSTLLLWDLHETPPRDTRIHGHQAGVQALTFSPNGQQLASSDSDGTLLLWDLKVMPPRSTPLPGHQGMAGSLTCSPDGKTLVTGGGWGTLLLWDLRGTPPRSTFLPGHRGPVDELALSPDGTWLASSDGSSLLLWDLRVPDPQASILAGHQGYVQAFTFSPDGKTLASGGTAGTLLLWDLQGTSPIATPLPGHQGGVSILAFSPDAREKMLVSGDDKSTLLLWDLRGTSPRSTVLPSHPDHRRIFSFSPDGKTLVFDNDESSLLLWDLRAIPHRSIVLAGYHGGLIALTFSPDGRTLASGDMAGTLRLWDLGVKPPRSMLLPGYQAPARSIGPGPTVGVREFTFSPDGNIVAATVEGTSLLWDLRMTPPVNLRLFHDQRTGGDLTFSPDSKTLASGATLWNVDFDSWPPHACRITNRNLTCTEWAQFMKDEPYRPTCDYLPFETCDGGLTGMVTLE